MSSRLRYELSPDPQLLGEAEEAECCACHRGDVQQEVLEEVHAVEVQEAQDVQKAMEEVQEGLKAQAS
jgi:hypothetical protein